MHVLLDLTDSSSFERARFWVNELKVTEEVRHDTLTSLFQLSRDLLELQDLSLRDEVRLGAGESQGA